MINLRTYKSASQRRLALEETQNIKLSHIGNFSFSEEIAGTKNCENMIGGIQIPVGVAGPIKITNENETYESYIPLATTEGALIASVNRGAKAVSQNKGVQVVAEKVGITRAPVFKTSNVFESRKLTEFIQKNFETLKTLSENTSSHLTLLEIKPFTEGKHVHARFRFDTQDAMGMNMATIAASNCISFIEEKTGSTCIALSGNMCTDKKPNFLNFIEGRGFRVLADAVIPEKIIHETLKTDAFKILDVYNSKIVSGSLLSGSVGANAHFSNILAALFLATGQDAAHIAENSMGITTVEKEGNDIYLSVLLPDLPIGIIGGGTQLATQKEALSILNLGDNQKIKRFAEIIGGAVLAGELSLISSLAQNSLACAHKTLGRGEKT